MDGNLASETWPGGGERHYSFDSLSRLTCVGPTSNSCSTLSVAYDSTGARLFEWYGIGGGSTSPRQYAGEYFTADNDRADYHILAFGERIAYKRRYPFQDVRTAELWVLPWGPLAPPPPLAVAIVAALGLAGLALLCARRGWVAGLREDPVLAAVSLGLVAVLVVPPLPAQAGGGGTVVYRRWILDDPLGSATVVLEADPKEPGSQEGRAEREIVYEPFGAIHAAAGSQGMDTDVFAGHPQDPTTGLHYMRARWQDPVTGSFLSVDPLVPDRMDPQAYNAFTYARNNPVTLIDPGGTQYCAEATGGCDSYVSHEIIRNRFVDRGDGHYEWQRSHSTAASFENPFSIRVPSVSVGMMAAPAAEPQSDYTPANATVDVSPLNQLEPSGIPGLGYEVDSNDRIVGVWLADDKSQVVGVRDRGEEIEVIANPSLDTGARLLGRGIRIGRVAFGNDGVVTSASISIGALQVPPAIGSPLVRAYLGPQPGFVAGTRAVLDAVNAVRQFGGGL